MKDAWQSFQNRWTKCHELAKAFLADYPTLDTEPNRAQLAKEIQQCVEDEIDYLLMCLKASDV
jgi:hypothetical protein